MSLNISFHTFLFHILKKENQICILRFVLIILMFKHCYNILNKLFCVILIIWHWFSDVFTYRLYRSIPDILVHTRHYRNQWHGDMKNFSWSSNNVHKYYCSSLQSTPLCILGNLKFHIKNLTSCFDYKYFFNPLMG